MHWRKDNRTLHNCVVNVCESDMCMWRVKGVTGGERDVRVSQGDPGSVDEPDSRQEDTVSVARALGPDGAQPPARWKAHKQM